MTLNQSGNCNTYQRSNNRGSNPQSKSGPSFLLFVKIYQNLVLVSTIYDLEHLSDSCCSIFSFLYSVLWKRAWRYEMISISCKSKDRWCNGQKTHTTFSLRLLHCLSYDMYTKHSNRVVYRGNKEDIRLYPRSGQTKDKCKAGVLTSRKSI
jgi:hypothetical protein